MFIPLEPPESCPLVSSIKHHACTIEGKLYAISRGEETIDKHKAYEWAEELNKIYNLCDDVTRIAGRLRGRGDMLLLMFSTILVRLLPRSHGYEAPKIIFQERG